jgi:hypothetical protein
MGSGIQVSRTIPNKKRHLVSSKDYSVADGAKNGTVNQLAFSDKVRRVACRSREVCHNFLRCLVMNNEEKISKMDLLRRFLSVIPIYSNGSKTFQVFTLSVFINNNYSNLLLEFYFILFLILERTMESHVEAQPISLFRS